jgi:AcrR family transcriptional regulator
VTTDEPAADAGAADATVSWRELAVARSLDSARTRAESRVQRFLDAAHELMNEGDATKDFTVQEVVERSGQSLRSFYQYFGGKHELLLALFEESVRSTAEILRQKMAPEDDAEERLHRFVVEYYRMSRPAPNAKPAAAKASSSKSASNSKSATTKSATAKASKKGPVAPVMVDFAQKLLTGYPTEAAAAFAPLVSLFGEVLDDAAEAGAVRPGLRGGPIAGIVLEAIMFNAFSMTIGGVSPSAAERDPAEELWELVLHGVAVTGS